MQHNTWTTSSKILNASIKTANKAFLNISIKVTLLPHLVNTDNNVSSVLDLK